MYVTNLAISRGITNRPTKIEKIKNDIYEVADEISKVSLMNRKEVNIKLKFTYKSDKYIGFIFDPMCFIEAYDIILEQYYATKLHLVLDELEDIRLLRRILKVFKQELKEIKKGIKEGQYD